MLACKQMWVVRSPREAFEAVVGRALFDRGWCGPPVRVAQRLRDGRFPSAYLQPGRLIEAFPEELREQLRHLRAEDTFDRGAALWAEDVGFQLAIDAMTAPCSTHR